MSVNKKELIRTAAIEVIATKGFYRSTTDSIAAAAGVSVGTIYNYFKNKDEILEYIFQTELAHRAAIFAELKDLPVPSLEKLQLFLEAHFTEIKANPLVGQILVRERQVGHDALDGVRAFVEGIPQKIASLLQLSIEAGEIKPCNPLIISAAIFGAVEAVVRIAVFTVDPEERNRLLDQAPVELVNFISSGLAK